MDINEKTLQKVRKKTVSLFIDKELLERLDNYCKIKGINKAALVTKAITDILDNLETENLIKTL